MRGYTLMEKLGEGGMGVVYRALQNELRREVALKILPAGASRDEELVQRFQREFRVLSQVPHPNIVRVFEWGEHEGQLFYAMELVRGRDLAASAPLPFAAAAPMFEQAADALAFLHEHGICHRDIKPHNLVVEGSGRLVLVDFGLVSSRDATMLTEAGSMMGTARFLAPEVLHGKPPQGPADVYALALTAQETLTGRHAVQAELPAALLAKIARAEVEPLTAPDVPPWFHALQARVLMRDPDNRPTARDYRDAIRAALQEQSVAGASLPAAPGPPASTVPTPGGVAMLRNVGDRTGRTRKGPSWPQVCAVLGAMALTMGVLAQAYRARGPERPGRGSPSPAANAPGATSPVTSPPAPRDSPAMPATAAAARAQRAERLARTFVVWPTERSALVDFDVSGPDSIRVELGGWASRAVQITRASSTEQGFVQLEVDALRSDTNHFMRIRAGDGAVLLADYRFKTLPKRHERAVSETLSSIRTRPSDGGELANFFREYPDARAVPALLPVAAVEHPDGLYAYDKIAMVARLMRNAALARALYRRLPRIEDARLKREVLFAAVCARVPEAIKDSLARVAVTTESSEVDTATRAAELTGGTAACEAVAAAVDRLPACARFAVTLPRVDRVCALAHARRWLGAPCGDLHHAAGVYALRELADDRAIELLAADLARGPGASPSDDALADSRIEDLAGWDPVPTAADALASLGRPEAVAALARALERDAADPALVLAAGRGGDATVLPVLEHALARPGTSAAIRREVVAAIASIGGPAARPALQHALADADPEITDTAAWGLSRPLEVLSGSGTVNISVPAGVPAVHTGIFLTAGQSVEISASGAWGRAGSEPCQSEVTCPVSANLPPLGLSALIGTTRWRVFRRPARLLVPCAGELMLTPWQQRPDPHALLARPALAGKAYVVIVR